MKTGRIRRSSPLLSLVIAASLLLPATPTRAQSTGGGPLQAFMLTATYGVIAGTLTGLASLAFYSKPGDHTRNIALGASLGLYMGIVLGAYIVYMPALKRSPGPSQDSGPSSDQDPINLSVRSDVAPTALPFVNWDPKAGGQLGVVYNF